MHSALGLWLMMQHKCGACQFSKAAQPCTASAVETIPSTLSSAQCFAFVGYICGLWAPGRFLKFNEAGTVLCNLLKVSSTVLCNFCSR